MITLYIKSIDRDNQIRHFDCYLNQLETALETLNLIAAAGNILLEVYTVEEGRRTSLPPQAFDGQDLTRPIRALQHQWEALLIRPEEDVPPINLPMILMVLQRLDQFEVRMAEHDSVITSFEKLISTAQEQLRDGNHKDRLIEHYQSVIDQRRAHIAQVQTRRDACLKRLTRLK